MGVTIEQYFVCLSHMDWDICVDQLNKHACKAPDTSHDGS